MLIGSWGHIRSIGNTYVRPMQCYYQHSWCDYGNSTNRSSTGGEILQEVGEKGSLTEPGLSASGWVCTDVIAGPLQLRRMRVYCSLTHLPCPSTAARSGQGFGLSAEILGLAKSAGAGQSQSPILPFIFIPSCPASCCDYRLLELVQSTNGKMHVLLSAIFGPLRVSCHSKHVGRGQACQTFYGQNNKHAAHGTVDVALGANPSSTSSTP